MSLSRVASLLAGSLSLGLLSACTHWGGDKLKSDWSALEQADSLKCRDVPLKNEDLRIERIHIAPELGPSLVIEVLNRRGVRGFYHLPFRSLGELKEDALIPLPVSQESLFLGAGISASKPVFILRTGETGKAKLQVRDLQNNAILSQFAVDASAPWDLGPWTFNQGVLRALVREIKDDEAIDDQAYLQLELNTKAKPGAPIRTESSRQVIGQASLFSDSQNRSQILWFDRGTSEKIRNEPGFEILPWKAGQKGERTSVEGKGRTESWAFLEAYDHTIIASIKGDSLLWENASVDTQRLSKVTPFMKESQTSLPLARVHVAQPLLTQGPKGEYLLLPQWLDHELTVALYELADKEAKPKGFAGVFKEGTAFYKAFYHEPSEAFYLLSKAPAGSGGRFSLCQIDL